MKRNLNRDMDFFSNNATRIVYLFPRHVKFMNIWTLVIVFISLFFPTYKQSVFFIIPFVTSFRIRCELTNQYCAIEFRIQRRNGGR